MHETERLEQLKAVLREHGPFRERDVMAVNAQVALEVEAGNKSRAAHRLGLTRKTFKTRLRWLLALLGKDYPPPEIRPD